MALNAKTIDASSSFLKRGNGSSDETRAAMTRHGPSPILAGPCLLTGLREYRAVIAENQSLYSLLDRAEGNTEHDDVGEDRHCHHAEKKRRLSTQQVKSLELSFKIESKLEPERKNKLAQDLGLQPRQVAIWFQNRRARCKTKQLEQDFGVLKMQYETVCAEKRKLEDEVARLKGLLDEGSGGKPQPQPQPKEEEEKEEERWVPHSKKQQAPEEEERGIGSRSDGGAAAGTMRNDDNDNNKFTMIGEEEADMAMRRHNNSSSNNSTGSPIQVSMEMRYGSNPAGAQQIAMKLEEGCYVTELYGHSHHHHNSSSNNYYFMLDDQTTVPILCFDWPPNQVDP